MSVIVVDPHRAEAGPLNAAIAKAEQYSATADVYIYCSSRVLETAAAWEHPGWLEYTIQVRYHTGELFCMGMIQRRPDAEIEFHS